MRRNDTQHGLHGMHGLRAGTAATIILGLTTTFVTAAGVAAPRCAGSAVRHDLDHGIELQR